MLRKPFKTQAVAHLLGLTPDRVRILVEESGIEVQRQADGPKTRQFSIENVFDLARFITTRAGKSPVRKQVVATIYAPKGGVGKTTLASNLACLFPLLGVRTLVVDLDFQSNLTLALGYDSEITAEEAARDKIPASQVVDYHFGYLMPGWTKGTRSLAEVIKKPFGENGPHLVPADLMLDNLDTFLTFGALQGQQVDLQIAKLIADGRKGRAPSVDLSQYDVILFDAAPAKNRMTRGALTASDFVISPVSMEKFSTKALSYLSQVLTEIHDSYQRSPDLLVVANFFDKHRQRVIATMSEITSTYENAWVDETIRRSEAIPKLLTTAENLPIALAMPTDDASEDIRAVAKAVLLRMGVL